MCCIYILQCPWQVRTINCARLLNDLRLVNICTVYYVACNIEQWLLFVFNIQMGYKAGEGLGRGGGVSCIQFCYYIRTCLLHLQLFKLFSPLCIHVRMYTVEAKTMTVESVFFLEAGYKLHAGQVCLVILNYFIHKGCVCS